MLSAGPDPSRLAKIVGSTIGSAACLFILAAALITALWSTQTYQRRAQQRVIEDQVYNLVVGIRQWDPLSDDTAATRMQIEPKVELLLDPVTCFAAHSCMSARSTINRVTFLEEI